jgi:hypothetical protein
MSDSDTKAVNRKSDMMVEGGQRGCYVTLLQPAVQWHLVLQYTFLSVVFLLSIPSYASNQSKKSGVKYVRMMVAPVVG